MPNNIADYVVQVYVTFEDGGTSLGTAYPVSRNRLLTAAHVVERDGVRAATIELRWFANHSERQTDWIKATILSLDAEKLDIAILESEFPEADIRISGCLDSRPTKPIGWTSWGYPAVGKDMNGFRNCVSVIGTLHPSQSWSDKLDLGIDYTVTGGESWVGISGAPVFVEDRIVGIIIEYPGEFEGGRLIAASIDKALEIPEFKSKIGINDEFLQCKEKWDIERRGFEDFVRENMRFVNIAGEPFLGEPDQMFKLSIVGFLIIIENSCEALGKYKDDDVGKFIAELCDRALSVVNGLVREGFVRNILDQRSGSRAPQMTILARMTMAEIVMSAVDRRTPKFRVFNENNDHIGDFAVPPPAPMGLDATIDNEAKAVSADLARQFATAFASTEENEEEYISRGLQNAIKRKKSRYLMLREKKGVVGKSAELADVLNRKFPALVIFGLSDHDHADEEISLPELVASIYSFKERYST